MSETTPPTDLADQLETSAAEWAKCEEPIDSAASMRLATLLREAAAELRSAGAALEYVRGLGEVYKYPSDWNCAKMNEHPPLEAYERIDLSSVGA
jgi:hypothetical protein